MSRRCAVCGKGPTVGNILYQRPKPMIKLVEKALGVRTYREVGERTFDYFVEAEGIADASEAE